jgi:membrane-bound metal-dependent hydrolase YbcI (DUF457 family)
VCEGLTHTLGGGFLWLGGTWVASRFGADLSPAAVGVGTLVAMGAAQLPDTDHPDSAIAHALGPVSQSICRVVSAQFHHRAETHYLVSVPVWALLAAAAARVRLDVLGPPARLLAGWWPDNTALAGFHRFVEVAGGWQLGLFAVVALLAAWALRLLNSDLDHACGGAGEIVAGAVVAGAAFAWVPLGGWVPAAVAVGVLSHDLADLLTKGPYRFLWPLPWRFSAGLFVTGHGVERTVVAPVLLVLVAGLGWVRSVQPLAQQAHVVLAGLLA